MAEITRLEADNLRRFKAVGFATECNQCGHVQGYDRLGLSFGIVECDNCRSTDLTEITTVSGATCEGCGLELDNKEHYFRPEAGRMGLYICEACALEIVLNDMEAQKIEK